MGNDIDSVQKVQTETFGEVRIFSEVEDNVEISKLPEDEKPEHYSYKGNLGWEQKSELASEASAQTGTLMMVVGNGGEHCSTSGVATTKVAVVSTTCKDHYYLVVPKKYADGNGGTATCDLENVTRAMFPADLYMQRKIDGFTYVEECYDFLATRDPNFSTDYEITRVTNRWHGIDWLSPDYYIIGPK